MYYYFIFIFGFYLMVFIFKFVNWLMVNDYYIVFSYQAFIAKYWYVIDLTLHGLLIIQKQPPGLFCKRKSFMKRQTSDNEWQRVTTSDNKWYNEWQWMTTSDKEWHRVATNDNEWYNERQRVTTNNSEW